MDRIYGLNTLRFLSFLAIFLFHTFSSFSFAYLGVDFFFVLSSFLLTYLALKELENTGSFSKLNFFIRRVLRIFPLYFAVLTISLFVIPLFYSNSKLPENKLLYWVFLNNYDYSDCIYALKFLWSIAVEEQFYLVFIILSFLFNRSFLALNVILILIFSAFAILSNYFIDIPLYTNTATHLPNFIIGINSALLFYKLKDLKFWPLLTILISLPLLYLLENIFMVTIVSSFLFGGIILFVSQNSTKLSNIYPLKLTEQLGKYTYGLYVFSGFVLTFSDKFIAIENNYIKVLCELLIIVVVAITSYHLYEKPFLKLKHKFR